MRTIVIDRAKWRTGHTSEFNKTGLGSTRLENIEGYCCCLGFACAQLGFDVDLKYEPSDLRTMIPGLTEYSDDGGFYRNSAFSNDAMEINDDGTTTPKEKEKLLVELCEKYPELDMTFEFIGEYPKG